MNYWLVKSEPDAFSWDRFVLEGRAVWDGVRNYQARNNLKAMKVGDQILFYHSVTGMAVVGLARVDREAYPDPTAPTPPNGGLTPWVVVELVPEIAFARPVSLAQLKAEPMLQHLSLIRQSRLSVMPIKTDEFELILAMGML